MREEMKTFRGKKTNFEKLNYLDECLVRERDVEIVA